MIPLSVPNLNGNELKYVSECISSGWISSAGDFVGKFESEFASWLGRDDAVSTVNGTAALHLALRLLGVGVDDAVVVPNITFVASVNAVRYCGAEPILMDINPRDWQLDLTLLEEFFRDECGRDQNGATYHLRSKRRIAALMIVHVQGHMCDMSALLKICASYGVPVLEDAAEALGAEFDGQSAGTLGDFGCFSFNGNKIMSTGGGGMLIGKDKTRLDYGRHLATTAKTDPLRYHHDDVGYNYRLVNVLAAIGVAQLEQLDSFLEAKRRIAGRYERELAGVGDVGFQLSSGRVNPNHWLFTITTNSMEDLLAYLNSNGIMSRPFWAPINTLPMYEQCTYVNTNDTSAKIHASALSIPCSTNLSDTEQDTVIQTIRNFFSR